MTNETQGAQEITVDVSGDMEWFAKQGVYPVLVEVSGDRLRYHGEAYRRYAAPGGGFHISREGTSVYLGTVNSETVTPTLSKRARKTLQVFRSALFNVPYLMPVAFKVGTKYVHEGRCWASFQEKHKPTRTSPLYDVKADKRCAVCKQGWDM